jgi:5-methylcytosine-specific restriction endonuclease McrA
MVAFGGSLRRQSWTMPRSAYGPEWRKARAYVLRRDGWECQIGLEGCTGVATEVDHVDPVAVNGTTFDVRRLRAACHHCNHTLGGRLGAVVARINRTSAAVGPSREW